MKFRQIMEQRRFVVTPLSAYYQKGTGGHQILAYTSDGRYLSGWELPTGDFEDEFAFDLACPHPVCSYTDEGQAREDFEAMRLEEAAR